MSAHVLLNLLNKLRKQDKMRGLPSILSLFCNNFNKFNNTGARMLDSMPRSRTFLRGCPGPTARKQSGKCWVFFSPQLILKFTEEVQWCYYSDNYTFPRIQRGSNNFQGESNFFQGGFL